MIREIREETGIDVSQAAGGYASSYKRVNPEEKNNYFVDIYKFILDFVDNDVKVQSEEVEALRSPHSKRSGICPGRDFPAL